MSDMIHAPFTPEQVKALNEYQEGGWFHPFTCGICRDTLGTGMWPDDPNYGEFNERKLVATEAGWICPTCDYTQNWAWEGMTMGPPTAVDDLRR